MFGFMAAFVGDGKRMYGAVSVGSIGCRFPDKRKMSCPAHTSGRTMQNQSARKNDIQISSESG